MAGKMSSPGPAPKNNLCCSVLSNAMVRYHDRQICCTFNNVGADSSEKTAMRSSGTFKTVIPVLVVDMGD